MICKVINEILATIAKAENENDRQFVVALARGLSILYSTRTYPLGISYQQICEMTGLPKPTVSRLLHTLQTLKFIRQNPHTSLYQAGARLLELTAGTQSVDVTEQIKPLMLSFAARHHVSVSLAKAQFGEMLYVQCVRSPARLTVQLHVGSTVPMPDTAIGRAYYASLDEAQKAVVQMDLKRIYPHQFKDKLEKLEQAAEFMKAHGFTVSDKDFSEEVVAIALTVKYALAPHGIFALNASAPSAVITAEDLVKEVAGPLQQLAKEVQSYFVMN